MIFRSRASGSLHSGSRREYKKEKKMIRSASRSAELKWASSGQMIWRLVTSQDLDLTLQVLGFSFLLRKSASSDTPATFTTLNRTPGRSPTECPDRPNPEMRTSSFSSTKFRHPSPGTKAAIFLPFLMSWTRHDFRMAELGCFASMPIRSRTIPLACDAPLNGLALRAVVECLRE
jgi:hypothetical protein